MSINSIMNKVPKPSSAGKRWTVEEEDRLIQSMNSGTSIEDIAKEHKRTVGGIKSRIKKTVIVSSLDLKSFRDIISEIVGLKPEEIKEFLLKKKQTMEPGAYIVLLGNLLNIVK